MATPVARKNFLTSPAAGIMREELTKMLENPAFNTNVELDVRAAFIDKHLNYINKFAYIDPHQYVMNLKMKSRI